MLCQNSQHLPPGGRKGIKYDDGDVSLLKEESELTLIRSMLQLPEIIE